MGKKFGLKDNMLNNISKVTENVGAIEAKENFNLIYVPYEKIIRNPMNFYPIDEDEVKDLAEKIAANTLKHNLVVSKNDDDTYMLISGERRWRAIGINLKNGDDTYKLVPCKLEVCDDIDAEIGLITSNADVRERDENTKRHEAERLNILYKQKKARGEKVPGGIRNLIAKVIGESPSTIAVYDKINKHLIPELIELLEINKLSTSSADHLASLSDEQQMLSYNLIIKLLENNQEITKTEAFEIKKSFIELEKEKNVEIEMLNNQIVLLESNKESNLQLEGLIENNESIDNNEIETATIKTETVIGSGEVVNPVNDKEELKKQYEDKIKKTKDEYTNKMNEKLDKIKNTKTTKKDKKQEVKEDENTNSPKAEIIKVIDNGVELNSDEITTNVTATINSEIVENNEIKIDLDNMEVIAMYIEKRKQCMKDLFNDETYKAGAIAKFEAFSEIQEFITELVEEHSTDNYKYYIDNIKQFRKTLKTK